MRIHDFYYPAILAVYVLALFFGFVRPGVASAVFVSAVALFTAVNVKREMSAQRVLTEDIVMGLWLVYNILSGIWCVFFGLPVSVYLGELFTTALPMCFYFCGRTDSSSKRFSLYYLISVSVVGVLGIVLFITGPKFYIDYLMKLQLISKPDIETMRVRMHSVMGSTLMGYLSAVGMLISVRAFLDAKEKKGKYAAGAGFLFMLFLAFMSNQRSAMAAAILILIYLNILVFFVFEKLPKKYFLAECLIILAGAAGLFLIFNGAFMKVYYRLISLPGSISQRSDQWVGAANNMKNIWLGNGLGANGHRAIGYAEHVIADGGIAKLYVESGIIGTSLFVFLILLILKKGFSFIKDTAPETGIVLIVLAMSIGSNMLSFALSVPVLYYYMGRNASIAASGKERESGEV